MLRDWGSVCWCMLRGGDVYAEGLGLCMVVHAEGWGCVWWCMLRDWGCVCWCMLRGGDVYGGAC